MRSGALRQTIKLLWPKPFSTPDCTMHMLCISRVLPTDHYRMRPLLWYIYFYPLGIPPSPIVFDTIL